MKERNDMIFVLCVKSDKCLTKFDLTFSPENFKECTAIQNKNQIAPSKTT
jgi:hypothetical protein